MKNEKSNKTSKGFRFGIYLRALKLKMEKWIQLIRRMDSSKVKGSTFLLTLCTY
jgi:hypothetical protein